MHPITTTQPIYQELENHYYSIIPSKNISIPDQLQMALPAFQADWEQLEIDNYLKDGKTFRYRRFRYLYYIPNEKIIRPFAPTSYYQTEEINHYAGGIDRDFQTISNTSLQNPFFEALLHFDFEHLPLTNKQKSRPWLIDAHQIRVVAKKQEAGEATPEGIHHDGNTVVWVHLLKRENIKGGVSGIYSNQKKPVNHYTLADFMDSMAVLDDALMHGVSPFYPVAENKPAYRDVFLTGLTHCPSLNRPSGNSARDYIEIKRCLDIFSTQESKY